MVSHSDSSSCVLSDSGFVRFVDGALGANNAVYALWNQAQDVWGNQLRARLQYLVSIGTGLPTLKPVRDDVLGIWATLKDLVTETAKTAQQFHHDKSDLDDEGRYYRFDVDRGLEQVGKEESKKKTEIAAATRRYVELQPVFKQMKACANSIAGRELHQTTARTEHHLACNACLCRKISWPGRPLPKSSKSAFSAPSLTQTTTKNIRLIRTWRDRGDSLAADFARRHLAAFSSVFWLDGRSEDRLKQSLASCASGIPEGQIHERSRNAVLNSEQDLMVMVTDALDWLALPDNIGWLLILDNVDQDVEQKDGETGAYDVQWYLPGDHGRY
ncbi:hypothetical protein GE09DRAFT_1051654 [Coniochaeta sp. 2T2.1]|nr:hypothetical protein GE09DRAFT_1051654 [Coniochaeta sp. 2T2.1]